MWMAHVHSRSMAAAAACGGAGGGGGARTTLLRRGTGGRPTQAWQTAHQRRRPSHYDTIARALVTRARWTPDHMLGGAYAPSSCSWSRGLHSSSCLRAGTAGSAAVVVERSGFAQTSSADQSLYALHSADSQAAVQRCVAGLLGIRVDEDNTRFADSVAATEAPPQSGPLLLSGAVYELLFTKLTAYPSPRLAAAVYTHMTAMRMQPSHAINLQLLRLLAQAPRTMATECARHAHDMVDDLRARRNVHDNAPNDAREYINIALGACVRAGHAAAALQLFRYFDDPTLQETSSLRLQPDATSFAHLLSALCRTLPTPLLDGATRVFAQMRSAVDESGRPLVITQDTWTDLIVAHAIEGQVDQALQLLRDQQRTLAAAASASISSSPSSSSGGVVSVRAFIATILACSELPKTHADHAVALWLEMHRVHKVAHLKHPHLVPFAYEPLDDPGCTPDQTPSSDPALVADRQRLHMPSIRFHFGSLAVRQFRSALLRVYRARQEGLLTTATYLLPLEELESAGRCYLAHFLALEMDGEAREPTRGPHTVVLTPRAAISLMRVCTQAKPHAQWRQAEAIFRWMAARGIEQQDGAYYALVQCYTEAYPRALWRQALNLKHDMDEAGVTASSRVLAALLESCARACAIVDEDEASDNDLPLPLPHRGADLLGGLHVLPASASKASFVAPATSSAPPEVTDAFQGATSLFRQIHPSLLTPAMHLQLLQAAIQAGENRTALDIFQTQYNADVARMAAIERVQELEFEDANAVGMFVRRPRSELETRLSDRLPEQMYFRATLDIATINGLMHACSALHNPFHALQLWQLLHAPWQSDRQPSAFVVPVFASPEPPTMGPPLTPQGQLRALHQTPPPVTWAEPEDMTPNYATHWQLVSWIDALLRLKFEKAKKPEREKRSKPQAAASTPPSTPSTSVATIDPDAHRIVLPTLHWSSASLGTATPADLTTLIGQFQEIERSAYARLATSTSTPSRQSIWQSFTQDPSAGVFSKSFKLHSRDPPSPLHLNLHALASDHVRSNLEGVLHLSLRRIQALYIATGKLEATGWSIVHGHGKGRDWEERQAAAQPRRVLDIVYASAPRSAWKLARFRCEATDSGAPAVTSALARVVHRFLFAHLGIRPQLLTQDGNPGMTRVNRKNLTEWMTKTSA